MCWVWVCGRVFLCTQAGLQLNYVAKAGFTFAAILLPLPPRWSARMLGVCLTRPSHVHVCGVSFSIWWLSANRSSCFSVVIFLYLFPFFKTGSLVGWELPRCASACLCLSCKGFAYTLPHTSWVLGTELGFSYLHGKHLTDWAISSALGSSSSFSNPRPTDSLIK